MVAKESGEKALTPLKQNSWRPWLLAVASGVLGFLGYVGFDQFYLQWIFLLPLLFAIRTQSPRRAFFIAWLAGTVGHSGGFCWVAQMLVEFANTPWAVGVVGVVMLAAVNALLFGLWGWSLRKINLATNWPVIWLGPILWVGLENIYPAVFPNYIGAGQYRLLPITQVAELTGILGVSFLVIWTNTSLYSLLAWWRHGEALPKRSLISYALGLVVLLGFGFWRIASVDAEIASAHKIKVGLVQTNLGAASKHTARRKFILKHQQMSQDLEQAQQPELIVWPEGAFNSFIPKHSSYVSSRVFGRLNTPLLFGAPTFDKKDDATRRYNSALLIDAGGKVLGQYDKQVLMPFGEYIPFGDWFPIFYKWSPYSARFWPGTSDDPIAFGDYWLATNVCYEDLFPDLIARLMNARRAEGIVPHAIFNITNDSWYGDSTEPLEHLALASFRAIEQRRSVVRSTNTGLSAIVDPVGRLSHISGQWTEENVVGKVPMMTGRTIFNLLGNSFGWLLTLASFLALGQALWNKRRRGEPKSQ